MDITVEFTETDARDLAEFKEAVSGTTSRVKEPMQRHIVTLPRVEASTEEITEGVEKALEEGKQLPRGMEVKLPPEVIEGAKAAWTASGGNTSEVAALYDLTPESVVRLASQENWPIYNGTTKLSESKSRGQLKSLQAKLWNRIESVLDSIDIEEKAKEDITQHRLNSQYVEPLASRSSAFKVLMDQYMRVSTLLEPELFSEDPDPSNFHANRARNSPSNVKEVNREIADFFSQVVVGIHDRVTEKAEQEREGYGNIIDARAQ